jgi:hypothetical protein
MNELNVQARRVAVLAGMAVFLAGCGGGGSSTSSGGGGGTQPLDVTLTLSSSTALVLQDGTPASVGASLGRSAGDTNSITLSASGLPAGMQAQFVQPGSGSAGTVTLVASSATPAGAHTVTIQASEGGSAVSHTIALTVGIVATVGGTVDSSAGVGGKLQQFMGTVLEPDAWRHWFLPPDWDTLNALGVRHIRFHTTDWVPMKANTGQASDWDFTKLNETLLPTLEAADHSPMFTIVIAPSFLNIASSDASGLQFVFNDANLNTFAQYCANLVRYYNAGGFDWGGQHFQSPSNYRITWWQIFNEYNINGLLPSQYIRLYNTVVPAMKAVDPSIKFSALELADWAILLSDPRNNLPWFVAPPASGGVNAPVDAAAVHLYSSSHQTDTDARIFGTIPGFAEDIRYIYRELRSRPDLANVPVWVTESGVNVDYQVNGISNSTGGPFLLDARGSNAFFAAWQPYLFSQIGKAGNQGLVEWSFSDDEQRGLINEVNNAKYMSYWVEYWLLRKFPWDGVTPGPDILTLNATETSSVETLATRNSDGSVVVMVADHAVHATADNNGSGDPRTVVVDVSALGAFATASQLTIDSTTNTVDGPAETAIALAPRIALSLGGYGVTFVTLHPQSPASHAEYNEERQTAPRLRAIEAR